MASCFNPDTLEGAFKEVAKDVKAYAKRRVAEKTLEEIYKAELDLKKYGSSGPVSGKPEK